MIYLYTILIGYLLGCFQASYFISKYIHGFDIRNKGTGNAGASNMVATLGWKTGFITATIDVLKASAAVWIVAFLFHGNYNLLFLKYLAGCSAVIGHIFPFFMNFKGGKGLASFMGLLFGINPLMGISYMALVIILTLVTDYVALASILVYISFPVYGLVTNLFEINIFYMTASLGIIGVFKHKINIQNMLNGAELGFWTVVKGKHKQKPTYLILDFDSTIITAETLDELSKISLMDDPDKEEKINQISSITEKAMNGEIHFMDALNERIKILQATQVHLDSLKEHLHEKLSPSFKKIKNYIRENADNIYVVSGGFTELIYPVVKEFGISESHIFANVFTFDETGLINGVDSTQFLAQKPGKIDAVKSLNLNGTVIAIGDGWTDYQIKESGLADYFIAYTESVSRPPVIKKGDIIATSFNDVLNFINTIKK
ncbi:MAG: glycerol-3-phosphate acyltransferase [Candidatus Marinimicrobia bacterium]|nr:glycerol-3-phosphate acyltransferase [Candidatus Neomarinimicrobiota bacterium]